MDFLRLYGNQVIALIVTPALVYGIGTYLNWRSPTAISSGPLIMLKKSLTRKDSLLMELLKSPEHLKDCWVISDPAQEDNPIIYASPGFCKMTGYEFDEIIGKNCRFLQEKGARQGKEEVMNIKFALAHETEATACLQNFRKDGTAFSNEFFITPLHSTDGSLCYYLGMQIKAKTKAKEGADNAKGSEKGKEG